MAVSYISKARKLFQQNFPDDMLAIQPKSNWTGEVPLPGEVADYYANLGPVDIKLPHWPETLTLPSLRRLWILQGGYIYDPATGEHYKNWPEGWLVIARAGDKAVYVYNAETGRIDKAVYKRLRWKAKPAFESLGQFIVVAVALGKVVRDLGDELMDADGNLTEEAGDRALLETFELMGRDIDKAEALLIQLGWIKPDDD